MLAFLSKPKVLMIGLTLQAVVLLIVYSSVLMNGEGKLNSFALNISNGSEILVYFLAGLINFKISREYKNNPLMQSAWIFLGLNAFVSIGRALGYLPVWNALFPGYYDNLIPDQLNKIVIIIANSCLFLGLWLMGLGFKKSGLGFEIGIRGYVEILCIIILTIVLFMIIIVDPYSIGLIILSAAAIASVVLHKIALRMGGGKLAITLRLLTLYTLMRAVFVILEYPLGLNDLERRQHFDTLMMADLIAWKFIPWVAALAAAYRVELTVHATKELKRSEEAVLRATV